uniref:Malonyl-CoA/methylmalonyl-CoA synthetase n=1 Tax=Candidatus Kentrum sp. SD TaxID=2126332 RepID=A0A450Z571_9GAMM|nr:MAG: malonyl-CoA/methylmalonyl-CoA synthetase [Candidatus Kentron sp. SD]VFK48970.1 MAG: malonyl-CoA/methylmalonyl-CoA synthetase [Candidatus Kentron sp. SD]
MTKSISYSASQPVGKTNLYALFASRFPEDASRTFIETPTGRRYSYGDLERETARFANVLGELDLRPGDRIAVSVEKSPEAIFLYLACLRAGVVYLPLNTAYRASEIEYFVSDAEPKAMVCRPKAVEPTLELAARRGIEHILTLDEEGTGTLTDRAKGFSDSGFDTVHRAEEDVAAILYTSGTTGRPKGTMLTHGNLASNALVLHEAWRWTSADVLLHALPLFHVHGLFVACHGVLSSGAGMILLPGFDVRSVLAQLPRTTVFMGVPTYYNRLLLEPEFSAHVCAAMRLFISGSAPLSERVFHAFRERSGHTILERYGMTETLMNTSNPYDSVRKPGSVGPALPGVGARIVNESGELVGDAGGVGEIQIKGPNVFKGYWRQPEKTAEEFTPDGWFRTGDLGVMDEAGYLSIVGRSKDLIITGGYNVYPREVEGALDSLDGIRESAVIGVPDPDFGEQVIAVIIREPDGTRKGETVTESGIIEAMKERIANYKAPKRILFVEDFPRNAMGKVQKNVLRAEYAGS